MDSKLTEFLGALLWLALLAFAIWLIGWSMNLWWYLGWG